MAKSKKKSTNESGGSFEEAVEQLQQIVDDLEDGKLGLEDSMQRFEKGIVLLRQCYQTLEQAEQKIQILTGIDEEGNPVTTPFDATSTLDQSKNTAGRRSRKKKTSKQADSDKDEDDTESTLF